MLKKKKNLTLNGSILVNLEKSKKLNHCHPQVTLAKETVTSTLPRETCNNLIEEAAFQGILILLKLTYYFQICNYNHTSVKVSFKRQQFICIESLACFCSFILLETQDICMGVKFREDGV